jgi:hypothetical protein
MNFKQSGYYWVKREGAYAVGCWDAEQSCWWLPGYDAKFSDTEVKRVSKRLLPPREKQKRSAPEYPPATPKHLRTL